MWRWWREPGTGDEVFARGRPELRDRVRRGDGVQLNRGLDQVLAVVPRPA